MSRLLHLLPLALFGCWVLMPYVVSAATKTEQVEQYLGTERYKRERPVGIVKFVFKRAVLKRQGDGKKTYEQLLISEPGFSNRDNAGPLKSIQIVYNGQTIVVEPESVRLARKQEQEAAAARAKEERRKKQNTAPPSASKLEKAGVMSRATEGPAAGRRAEKTAAGRPAEKPSEAPAEAATRVKPLYPAENKSGVQAAAMPAPVRVSKGVPAADPAPVTYGVPSAAEAAPLLISDPVRPRQNIPPRPGSENKGISLPDSMTVVRNIEEAKEQITTWKGRLWQTIKPAWEFVMWLFSSLIVILICFAGICRYVAKTAASESLISAYGRIIVGRWIVSAHQNAAAMLLVITWVIAIVLLLDVFMWLVYLNLPIWTLLIIWFPALWVAEKITSWIVPNIPIADGRH
ncbi:MAG: hypothetical protein RMJ33_04620 [Saprospiraceae bacterium]|nr:hypothetical protein [Saprospiraceae bacterium]MDW8229102.1 hypothetical protein [Saprospiraceae bacterium]